MANFAPQAQQPHWAQEIQQINQNKILPAVKRPPSTKITSKQSMSTKLPSIKQPSPGSQNPKDSSAPYGRGKPASLNVVLLV